MYNLDKKQKIKDNFYKIIGEYKKEYKIDFKTTTDVDRFQYDFKREIARKIIREYRGDPKDIFNTCQIIEEIIDKENFTKQIKNMISESIIRGYFTTCKYLFKKFNKTKKYEFEDKYIFSMDDGGVEDDLNNYIISSELKNAFETKGSQLSENHIIMKEKDNEWGIMIIGEEKEYIVKKEDEKLNVYKHINYFINSFERGLELYGKYPNKSAFEVLLGDVNFKTGPLSKEDIKLGNLYSKNLHKKPVERLKRVLESTGCFGISGHRGMGKSTILNVCMYEMEEKKKAEPTSIYPFIATLKTLTKMWVKNPLIVKLTVPSKYGSEEFLTALLSKICEEVKKEGDLLKPYRLMNIFNIFNKLVYSFLFLLVFVSGNFLLSNIIPTFLNIYQEILIYALLLLGIMIIISIALLSPNKILTYRHVDRIHNDIKFKKTFEITGGAASNILSFSRRTTFVENPINYSAPLLSDKIKDLIEDITEKAFNKVIIIIDDFDKLEKREYDDVLRSIRFLSSTKNCLTFIAVPERFEKHLEDMDSEVRTLFDQFIELEKIKKATVLQELIEHRIMNHKIGKKFSEILTKYEDSFYRTLLLKSGGVPREAIRLFDECFQDWYVSEGKTTIDDEFY